MRKSWRERKKVLVEEAAKKKKGEEKLAKPKGMLFPEFYFYWL